MSELKLNATALVFIPKQLVKNNFKTFPKNIVKEHLNSNTLSGRLLIALIESNFLLAKSFIDNDVRLNLAESEKYYPNLVHNLEELLHNQKIDEAFIILQSGIKFKFIFNPLSKLLSNLLVKFFVEKNQKYIDILMLHEIKLLPENLSENPELSHVLKKYLIDDNSGPRNSIFLINAGVNLPELNSEEEILISNLFKEALLQNNLEIINFYRKQNIKIINITEKEKYFLSISLKNSLLTNNIKLVDILVENDIKLPLLNITDELSFSKMLNNALLNYKNIHNQYNRIMNNKLIKMMIQLNIKINKELTDLTDFTNLVILLKEALLENNEELIDYLLKAGLILADIQKYDKSLSSIFREVILQKNIKLCKLFLSNNAQLNIQDKNNHDLVDLVFTSVKKNDIEITKICILADIYYRMYCASKFNIANIFLLACYHNQIEIIEFFYSEEFSSKFPNFDISYQNDDGFTGLMILVKNKNINAVKFMLEHKDKKDTIDINLNKFNFNESSALTIACEYNINNCNDELIMLLIYHGADVNQTTFKNQNALILSIEKNNSEMVSSLIDNGANFDNIINKEIYLDSILQIGHYEIIDLINKCSKLSPKMEEIKEDVSDKHIRKRGPLNRLFLF
jgi:hypothetical protein